MKQFHGLHEPKLKSYKIKCRADTREVTTMLSFTEWMIRVLALDEEFSGTQGIPHVLCYLPTSRSQLVVRNEADYQGRFIPRVVCEEEVEVELLDQVGSAKIYISQAFLNVLLMIF